MDLKNILNKLEDFENEPAKKSVRAKILHLLTAQDLKLTNQELSYLLDMDTRVMSSTLSQLKKQGLIVFEDLTHQIKIWRKA